jgi:hypothetical protein
VVGAPATLDPYSPLASDLTYALVRPLYPSLFQFDPDGSTRASLAARLVHTDKGVRVELARARWSDGSFVGAHDVLRSIARARPPSGFARVTSARRVSVREVALEGAIGNWRRALATLSFVIPDGIAWNGHGRFIGAGAFKASSYRAGLHLIYERNARSDLVETPNLHKLEVQFVESENVLLELLADDRLDAIVPPATVNLADRLDEMDVQHEAELGWESVRLELEQSLSFPERAAVVAPIDRNALVAGFVREDGVLSDTLHPGPEGTDGPWSGSLGKRARITTPIKLSTPVGDELLNLIQRALQIQLTEAHVEVEPITTSLSEFYGLWRLDDPTDVAIIRAAGAPGLRDGPVARRQLTALPIAQVRTYLAWRPGVHGLQVNPTFEGPLWNAEAWWIDRS